MSSVASTPAAPNWKQLFWTGIAFLVLYLVIAHWAPPIAKPWLTVLILAPLVWALYGFLPEKISRRVVPLLVVLWVIWCAIASLHVVLEKDQTLQITSERWSADKSLSTSAAMDPRFLEARGILLRRLRSSEMEYARHFIAHLENLDKQYASGTISFEQLTQGYELAAQRLDRFREANEKIVQSARGGSWLDRLSKTVEGFTFPRFRITNSMFLVMFLVFAIFAVGWLVIKTIKQPSASSGGHH